MSVYIFQDVEKLGFKGFNEEQPEVLRSLYKKITDLTDEEWDELELETQLWYNQMSENTDERKELVKPSAFDPGEIQLTPDDLNRVIGKEMKLKTTNGNEHVGEVISVTMEDDQFFLNLKAGEEELNLGINDLDDYRLHVDFEKQRKIDEESGKKTRKKRGEGKTKKETKSGGLAKKVKMRSSGINVARELIFENFDETEEQIAERLKEKGITLKTLSNVYGDAHLIMGLALKSGKFVRV